MATVHLDVAIGGHDQEPDALEVARQVEQQLEGPPLGPVQILQHDDQGLDGAGVAQEAGHRLEEAPTVLLRIERGLGGEHGVLRGEVGPEPLADLGDDTRHLVGAGAQLFTERLGRAGEDVVAHSLDEGQIRQGERALLIGVAHQGTPASHRDVGSQLLAEGGFSDAGLANHGEEGGAAGEGTVEGLLQMLQLRLASHEDAAVEGIGETPIPHPRKRRGSVCSEPLRLPSPRRDGAGGEVFQCLPHHGGRLRATRGVLLQQLQDDGFERERQVRAMPGGGHRRGIEMLGDDRDRLIADEGWPPGDQLVEHGA